MAIRIPKKPVANIVPFGLRLQPELKALLEAAAASSGRSLNSEISLRLEESLRRTPDDVGTEFSDPAAPSTVELAKEVEALRQELHAVHSKVGELEAKISS